jgi:DNA repair exonuclease SbcCD ATPase subunit
MNKYLEKIAQLKEARDAGEADAGSHHGGTSPTNEDLDAQIQKLEDQIQQANNEIGELAAKREFAKQLASDLDAQKRLAALWRATNNLAEDHIQPHVAKPADQLASQLGKKLEKWISETKENFKNPELMAQLSEVGYTEEEAKKVIEEQKDFLDKAERAVGVYNSGNRFLDRGNPKALDRASKFWNNSMFLTALGPYRNTPTQAGITSLLSGLQVLFPQAAE